MLNDPYWGRFDFLTHYPFEILVFNVTTLLDGFHPSEFKQPSDDPYLFAAPGLEIATLDDYLSVLDLLFRRPSPRVRSASRRPRLTSERSGSRTSPRSGPRTSSATHAANSPRRR